VVVPCSLRQHRLDTVEDGAEHDVARDEHVVDLDAPLFDGSGEIPRDPFVISHLVAAFNGGFQAMHGEFGMMADGVVYLPPKPYSATVAVLQDGSTGFGTWPLDQNVPDTIKS